MSALRTNQRTFGLWLGSLVYPHLNMQKFASRLRKEQCCNSHILKFISFSELQFVLKLTQVLGSVLHFKNYITSTLPPHQKKK